LAEAGNRALSLNSYQAAVRFYDEALALDVADEPARAGMLFQRARALYLAGDERREGALEEARKALLAVGDAEQAAEADALVAELWWHRGDRERSRENLERAASSIAGLLPSPAKARVLSQIARYKALAEENEEAITAGQEALAMAESLGLDDVRAHALNNVGLAKIQQGDMTGLEDLERSVAVAVAARSPDAARSSHNLGVVVWVQGDLRRSCELVDEAVALAERLGNAAIAEYSRHVQTQQLFLRGEWDTAGARADEFLAACDAGESHYLESGIRDMRARLRLSRDDLAGAAEDVEKSIPSARKAGDPQAVYPTLASAARLYVELGLPDEAGAAAREALDTFTPTYAPVDLAWVAEELGLREALSELVAKVEVQTPWHDVMRAYLASDFVAASELLFEIGDEVEEAGARLRAAEHLVAAGRRTEADEQLQKALAFWRSVGATRYIREGEALLAAAS
jgi:tetratricopeptide (TPR) repeat protein